MVGEESEPYRGPLRASQSGRQTRQGHRGASRPRARRPSRGVANDHYPAAGRRPHASQGLCRREGVALPDVPQNAVAPSFELRGEKGGPSLATDEFPLIHQSWKNPFLKEEYALA